MTEEFQWPENPPEDWWRSAGADVSATDQQIRFAATRFAGASASAAAKLAGYSGDAQGLRSSGYAALRSNAVVRLLQLAESERIGTADIIEASPEELKKTLASLLRSSDPTVKLRAAEQLAKLQSAEREAEALAATDVDPREALNELAAAGAPELALSMATEAGIVDFKVPELKDWGYDQVRTWILGHVDQAKGIMREVDQSYVGNGHA
jgi:hypothetical protein